MMRGQRWLWGVVQVTFKSPSQDGAERQNPLGYFTDVAPEVSFGRPSMRCVSSGPSSDGLVAEDQLTCGAFDSSYGCALARRGIASSRTKLCWGRRRRAS